MTSARTPKVVIGLQGAQMPANAVRGIGRWSSLYLRSLVRHRPDLVAAVSIDRYLPIPAVIHELPESVPVLFSEERPSGHDEGRLVFHAASIFEDMELDRIWPSWAQDPSVALVVTMYDTIPALFPDDYFQGDLRYLLESRYEMLAAADAVVAISRQTLRDTIRLLGIPEERMFVVPVEPPEWFQPYPGGRDAAFELLPDRLGIEPDFVLSIGNVDPRKNLRALIRAYACLPERLRKEHQLVLTCSQGDPAHLDLLQDFAVDLGVGDQLVITSFVDELTMVRLYQSCHTMILPSLYEGLGLPVVEAMRCGACTLAGNVGAIREVVHDRAALFDPHDVADIGAKLRRALEDPIFAETRRTQGVSDAGLYAWAQAELPIGDAYGLAAAARP
jgi:glycosyltransferase involved in cell wall biosynthesis